MLVSLNKFVIFLTAGLKYVNGTHLWFVGSLIFQTGWYLFTIASRPIATIRSHDDKYQDYLCYHILHTEFNEDTR